jgi:hypothetical protein
LTTVDLLYQWLPLKLEAVVEFSNSAATLMLAWVLLARRRNGFGWEQERGGGKVSMVVVSIGSLG